MVTPVWQRIEELASIGRLADAEELAWRTFDRHDHPLANSDSDRALARGDRPAALRAFAKSLTHFAVPAATSPKKAVTHVLIHATHAIGSIDAGEIAALSGLPTDLADFSGLAPNDDAPLMLLVSTIRSDHPDLLRAARRARPNATLAVWLWDNHHRFLWNYLAAREADIAFLAHAHSADYFSGCTLGPHVPLAVTQWTASDLGALYNSARGTPRSDRLYGHMQFYPVAPARNRLTKALETEWPEEDVRLLFSQGATTYKALSGKNRFAIWRGFKTSLSLPVQNDVSTRVFDALAAGQVPIVPTDTLDLDRVIPPDDQARLPIVRLSGYSVAAVRAAHARALSAFDAGGEAQAAARHRYVLTGHMQAHRIAAMIAHVRSLTPR